MTIRVNAKDVEVYIFNITDDFDPATDLATDENIMSYLDDEVDVTSPATITNITKISGDSNEINIEPQEDDVSNKKHFGTDSAGSQNSDTIYNMNTDVNITLNLEDSLDNDLNKYILDGITSTGETGDTGYERYNLGNYSTNKIAFFVKIEKLVNGTYYYKNYLIMNPVAKTPDAISGSADDSSLTNDYNFLGEKGNVYYDKYNRSTRQVSENFGNPSS